MSYQIFISYRRDGADALAQLFFERLSKLGFSVFYDVESLRSGLFNTKLFSVIDECTDVIVVMPPNGLERCISDENDWVRQEIAYAIEKKKNIIPIMMRGFAWPDKLPENIKALPFYNGITASMEFFDAVIQKIESMLKCNMQSKPGFVNVNKMYFTQMKLFSTKDGSCPVNLDDVKFSNVFKRNKLNYVWFAVSIHNKPDNFKLNLIFEILFENGDILGNGISEIDLSDIESKNAVVWYGWGYDEDKRWEKGKYKFAIRCESIGEKIAEFVVK